MPQAPRRAQLRGERDALTGLSLEQLEALKAEQEAAVERTLSAVIREREKKAAAEALLCSICDYRPRNCVLNCGHTFCSVCAEQMTACPQRCGAITSRARLYQ